MTLLLKQEHFPNPQYSLCLVNMSIVVVHHPSLEAEEERLENKLIQQKMMEIKLPLQIELVGSRVVVLPQLSQSNQVV